MFFSRKQILQMFIWFKNKFKTHGSFLTDSSKTLSYAMSTTMVTMLVSSDTMVILHFNSSLLLSSIPHLSLNTPNIQYQSLLLQVPCERPTTQKPINSILIPGETAKLAWAYNNIFKGRGKATFKRRVGNSLNSYFENS